jgi:hypothetical protein
MTYQVNRETYATAPYFLWGQPRPEPAYHHVVMQDLYRWELRDFEKYHHFFGALGSTWDKIVGLWAYFLGTALSIPLLALPCIFHDRKMRFPLITAFVFALGLAVETWTSPHYFAPATGLLYLILLQCMRHLRLWRRSQDFAGMRLVLAVPFVCVAMAILRLIAIPVHAQIEAPWPRGNLERLAVIHQLEQIPGNHLVIVKYGSLEGTNPDLHREWVYNAAEIDHARIVWARDMGEKADQPLLEYFQNRNVWLFRPDGVAPKLELLRPRENFKP